MIKIQKVLVKLKDGCIKSIYTDEEYYPGSCPTCNYGEEYISTVDLYLTKYTVNSSIESAYKQITIDEVLKFFLPNIEDIREMTEAEFIKYYKEWFYNLTSYKESIKFNIKELENN